MKTPYIVWTANRENKVIILIDEDELDSYSSLILKASLKFGINGSSMVLESSGTPVENEVLPYIKSEVLMVLQANEKWMPPGKQFERSFGASCSTVTILSDYNDFSTSTSLENSVIQEEDRETETNGMIRMDIAVDCNSENMWRNFQVPWEKLAVDVKEKLQKCLRDKYVTTTLVQLVVDEMRHIKKVIPCKAFKLVAKKMIDKYPEIFMDKDEDGVVLGDGSHSLVNKLIDRNNYLNRPHHKRKSGDTANPISVKKSFVSARAGCSNWAPINQDDTVNQITDVEKKMRESDENFYQTLEKTYPEIRQYLNNIDPPSTSQILEEWPIVFSRKSIAWHFQKLTNSNLELLNKLTEKSTEIIGFTNLRLKEVAKLIREDDEDNKTIAAITRIADYFKEDITVFFKTYKNSVEVDVEDLPLTPCIIYIDEEKQNSIYYIYTERTNIDLGGYTSFREAIKISFSLYFILNIKYPPNLEATLELLQRMFLKIHPDAGSKSKKNSSTKKKVLNFMNRFKEYRR